MPDDLDTMIWPTRDFMDSAEAISWIGYGNALRKCQWWNSLFGLSTNWEFHDDLGMKTEDPPGVPFNEPWHASSDQLLSTLKARVLGSDWPRYLAIYTKEGHKAAERYMARWTIHDSSGWAALVTQLESDIEQRDLFLEKLRTTAGKLRRELSAGRLTAWGFRGQNDFYKGLPRQRLLPEEWTPGVRIEFDGCMRDDWGIRWIKLTFETETVLSIWPRSICQTHASIQKRKPEPGLSPNDSADQWISHYVRSERERLGVPPKRDDTIAACRAGVPCTCRVALAAWNRLPVDAKRKPRSTKLR